MNEKIGNERKPEQKDIAKAYEQYIDKFTPKPKYFFNCCKAFIIGGALCTASLFYNNTLITNGVDEESAGVIVTITLIVVAQLLTGIGIFDSIAKFAGAGVIVPITGFANSMVATSIEFKKEGYVLGIGGKMFSVAGPVIVCGVTSATIVGLIRVLVG